MSRIVLGYANGLSNRNIAASGEVLQPTVATVDEGRTASRAEGSSGTMRAGLRLADESARLAGHDTAQLDGL